MQFLHQVADVFLFPLGILSLSYYSYIPFQRYYQSYIGNIVLACGGKLDCDLLGFMMDSNKDIIYFSFS